MIILRLVRSDGFEATEEVRRLRRGHGPVIRVRDPPDDSGWDAAEP